MLTEMLKAVGINLVIENVPSDVLFAGLEFRRLAQARPF